MPVTFPINHLRFPLRLDSSDCFTLIEGQQITCGQFQAFFIPHVWPLTY
jgi:hypothetical protein